MGEAFRVILLIGLSAAALTTGALLLNWWMEPDRRLRRAMLKSLGRPAETEAFSPLEGRAAGLDFSGGQLAVLWDRGADGLVFAFDEIEGAEMIVDGHVVARVRRGEARKSLDVMAPEASEVTLRLMFLDPRWPEFELSLWNARMAAQGAGSAASPAEALRLGRRWLSHVEALLR
ncbi:hypothetical protein ACO2Q1_04175 [Brevundimonas sp. VNH65]|uniref:hypothetical protein n=1 Tax=Brevundimonas sp. VNH65 TaxID=3400917 RepID=UPI003C129A9D